ncbi:hypothetical protein [Anaerosporobacter faecicola]|uniref:hypothetical protein n=1 Tax=Anaerosporobacter faecicola TaxID=2718714 RepID=UPI001438A0A3|nr:hypothetical protein [Anaerosporobacter faecicola]
MDNIVNYVYTGNTILVNTFSILNKASKESFDIFCLQLNKTIRESIHNIQNNLKSTVIHNKIKLLYSDLTDFDPDQCICFGVTVECNQMERVVMDIGFSGIFKLWVNRKPVCVGLEFQQRKFIELMLKRGKNEVIIEYINQKDNTLAQGYIQLYDYTKALNGEIFPLLGNILSEKKIEIISQYNSENGMLEYMLLCPFEQITQAEYITYGIPAIKEVQLRGLTRYKVNLGRYKDKIFHVGLRINRENPFISLAVNLPERQLTDLYERADHCEKEWDTKKAITIKGIRKKLTKMYIPKERRFELVMLLSHILHDIPVHTNRKYFVSDTDHSIQEVIVKEPEGYDDTLSYPLVLYLVDKEEYFFSESVIDCDEYILADFYCGGILGGGYMSEARYFEVLDYLYDNYNIDKNRVYLIGQSHSSFDLWFLLEHYPDLSAAAFLISGSPIYDKLMNVSNLPIVNVVSNYDYNYLDNIGAVKAGLKSENYQEVRCENIISASLSDFKLYPIADYFRNKGKDQYPLEVYFKSSMNRYLKSFWLTLYGISYDKTQLSIHGRIVSNERIELEVDDTDGFKVELPPFINRKSFTIVINQQVFLFEEYEKDQVIFLCTQDSYLVVSEWTKSIDYRKGIGILDVYMAPLTIYIPENYSKIVYETAEKFASPLTNGVVGKFDVHYPIHIIDNFDLDVSQKINNIFINVNQSIIEKELFYGTCLKIPIKTYNEYFEYKGIRYFGEYCVLQTIPHPRNNERSILFIHTNNEKLLTRNFLTRNVIIPFMFNGFHPYYHNEAVVLYEKRYYAIYEWDNDFVEIN